MFIALDSGTSQLNTATRNNEIIRFRTVAPFLHATNKQTNKQTNENITKSSYLSIVR